MSGPLVSAGDLNGRLGDERLVILDVRWSLLGPSGLDAYRSGHLPGAVFVDLDVDLAAKPDEHGRHPLPSATAFQRSMQRLGVSPAGRVVCYDQRDTSSAARAWWLLRYFGHGDVAVLDGGYDGWVASGLPVATEVLQPATGDFLAVPGAMPLVDAEGAARLASTGVLMDARAPERFAGRHEPVDPVAGHIPGAVNAPISENVDGDGRFRSARELRSRFAGLGASEGAPLGVYCGSGVNAAQQVLALELAGFSAALYADSWSGWITDPARPVATG